MRPKKLAVLLSLTLAIAAIPFAASVAAGGGPPTNNGWFNGQQIYYLDQGVEQTPEPAHLADIFLIGGLPGRVYQANVIDSVPGVTGYSPHWDVNLVHTAPGVTLADILASSYASSSYPEALFDSVADIRGAETAGLVTIEEPGIVVLCPVVNVAAADAPGHMAASEDFPPFPQEGF
jgi:hypothetical protein